MDTKTYVIVGVVAALLIVVLAFIFLGGPKPVPVENQNPVSFPTSNSSGGGTVTQEPGITTSAAISVQTFSGGTLTTNDFIHNGATIIDPSNAGNYYLTGTTTPNGFAIAYNASSHFFTISLDREPLANTRAASETFLLSALGITQNDLCGLNYYVGTSAYTNSFYTGKNLGFSFCPGATILPQ
jgi:hypothetical protein